MALTAYPIFEETTVHDVIANGSTSYGPVDNTALCRGARFRVEALDVNSLITAVTINGTPVSFPVGARVVYGDGSTAANFSISVTAAGRVRLVVWARDVKGYYGT